MLPYKSLLPVLRDSEVSLHIQVCNSFIALITTGTLQPGDSLPGSRVLAELLGINRNTVKLAYEELVSQGWAETFPRKGIFVLSLLPVRATKHKPVTHSEVKTKPSFLWNDKLPQVLPYENLQHISLAIDDGFPDVRLAPIDILMREYRSLARKYYGKGFLKYGAPMGSDHLREALQRYLANSRGLTAAMENIIITKGSQMSIFLTARLLLNPGDIIAVGSSNYGFADNIFAERGASLLRIPVDEKGMVVEHLEQELLRKKIKAVYIIPHHHFPTTVTMSMERRVKLLDLAKQYRFAIIEDDYDFDFHYDNKPYLPLASIDHHGSVIYIGSISKTFAPALRIGFMLGLSSFVSAAASYRQLVDMQGDTLMEEAFAALFSAGEMDRHYRKSLSLYRTRRNLFCDILATQFSGRIQFKVPEGGLGIWATFNADTDLKRLSAAAAKKGLYIGNGTFYRNESFSVNGQRLGFASLRENEIEQALKILKNVFNKM